jgi:putative membrane protein
LLYAHGRTFVDLLVHGSHFTLPWQPISVIGIAVAFYLGFKNNSSYDRTWEARKIWGGIVNTSRSFGAGVVSFIQGADAPADAA